MHQILLRELILYIDGNKSRLKCLSGMIISLMTGSSIYQKGLALGIVGDAKISSKTHRIYRFLKEFTFDYMKVASLILSFFCIENYVVAIDRTNWKFGKSDINILFLVIIIGKISVPVYWKSLPHGGVCSGELMKEFLQKFIKNLGVEKIKYLIADREFMNKEWLNFLINNHIKFAIPLKRDNKIRLEKSLKTLSIVKIFNDLKALEYKVCSGVLWDKKVNFAAYKNDKSELMVLVSSIEIEVDIFALYRYRWSIERLFKHLKSGGFDIEKSHLVNLDRFEKLLVVAAITSALIIKNGLIQNALNPIRIKSYKTIEKQLFSLFTYGFDYIKNAFYQSIIAITQLIDTLLLPPKKELFHTLNAPLQKL